MCNRKNCKVRPSFNIIGAKNPIYCAGHKLEGMVNVKDKTCIHEGCNVIPVYNVVGSTKRLYCVSHKLEGMVDVKHKTCIHENCKIRPIYNIQGNKMAVYCSAHKLEGMVNVVDRTCIYQDCKIIPNYNTQGSKTANYCSSHKLEGMVDVKNKTCIHEGCRVQANYNTEYTKTALYCAGHKLEGMVNVKNKTCKSEWCSTLVREKYDRYCLYCYMILFPDKPVSRNYKTKEFAVIEFIKTIFSEFDWVSDRTISGGCSRRRPDLLLDLGYQIIIIEIDENQHIDYDCSCENKRIMELSQDLGHRPIVFIRFNPDDYTKNETKVTSCWYLNKKGICSVKVSKRDEWSDRLTALENQIRYWVDPSNATNKTVEIIQLFYDV
jgi:hypothetical protein